MRGRETRQLGEQRGAFVDERAGPLELAALDRDQGEQAAVRKAGDRFTDSARYLQRRLRPLARDLDPALPDRDRGQATCRPAGVELVAAVFGHRQQRT